jgi:ABC-type lipoprotein export system ATPase subunit
MTAAATPRTEKRHGSLKKLAVDNHSAILVVTHDHRMVEGFDRILEVRDGVIVRETANGDIPGSSTAVALDSGAETLAGP